MLQSKLNASASFYMVDGGYMDAHLVTSESSNAELGIRHIGLRNPNTTAANAPIFKLSLLLTNGITIYGDIFANKDGRTLSVRWPQDSFVVDNRTQYIDRVNVPVAVTAQVLRHAQTQVAYTEKVAQPVQEVAPVQKATPVVDGIQLNTEPTPEELLALFAQA